MEYIHPHLRLWMDLAEVLTEAAEEGLKHAEKLAKPRRRGTYRTLRPGSGTPMWNACAQLLRAELKPYGSKVRLARYLGIPKQRVTDFLRNGSRMPDAEILLRVLHWLAAKRSGRDLSL
jgi:hypothetical protein